MQYQNILQEIKIANIPVGEPNEESKTYSYIDEQVMKFGSLQHDTIEWDILINSSTQYLTEICKDYKVLQYLIYALLQKNTKDNLINVLELFLEFNEKYLFIGYPNPAKEHNINRFKTRAILLIINRLEEAILNKKISFSIEDNNAIQNLIQNILKQLQPYIDESTTIFNRILKRLELVYIETTEKSIYNHNEIQEKRQQNSTITPEKDRQTGQLDIPDSVSADLSTERKLKQFYLQVADITLERDPSVELSYISRRYGLWHSITRLPEMNTEGITSMQAVSIDKLMNYRESVLNSPSIELLTKIEKTVVSSPYWIEGSYLAAQCCQSLKFDEAFKAIQNVTQQFVNKHKNFTIAKFQNGEPFIPLTISEWLMEKPISNTTNSMTETTNNFNEIYQSQGFVAVLKAIDNELNKPIDIRAKNYLLLDKINYLLSEGITTIALNELNELLESSKNYTIEEWDSSFFTQLNQLRNKLI